MSATKNENDERDIQFLCFPVFSRPVVFVIQNFNTFEANLVMSTLSPEEESVLLQQNQQLDRSQSSVQLPNISHSESILVDADPPSIATDTDGNASAAEVPVQRKRNRIVGQTVANAKTSDTSQVANDSADGCDILRKKRKTTERRATNMMPPPASERRASENPAPLEFDLLSENINVVFQDESQDNGLFPNDADDLLLLAAAEQAQPNAHRNQARKHGRDHRPIVRHVFTRCFVGSSQQTENLGAVVVDCSDEE